MPTRTKTDCRRFDDAPPESRHICHLDVGGDAPDTSRQDAIAADMAKLSAEQWEWVKGEYEKAAPDRAAAAQTARDVSGQQLEGLTLQNAITKGYSEDRDNLYRPLEQQIVQEAIAYDTPERREAEAGLAVADVGIQADRARQQQQRNMTRMGINPTSGAATVAGNQLSLGEAAAKAGAGTTARRNVELQGYARKADAANLGRGNASAQATSAGIATQTGNSAVGNAQVPGAITNTGIGVVGAGANNAIAGLGSAAGVYQNSAQLKANAGDNSGLFGALGAVGGGLASNPALFMTSDKKQKTDRKKVAPEISLAAIRRLPDAESYRYKSTSPADDGGQVHTGHMAQDVEKVMGDETAPGGVMLDPISLHGHTINAVKALDKRLLSLENHRKA